MKTDDRIKKLNDPDGFIEHCRVAALIINTMEINPHTKHHIRTAIREASGKVTSKKGTGKKTADYISSTARKKIENGDFSKLELDHAVPVSHMTELIMNLKSRESKICPKEISNIILQWTIRVLITKDEHDSLLKKKMPESWDGKNKFARYELQHINLDKF